jgi:aminoglycoside phosphotransferase (APT) family kinase protein
VSDRPWRPERTVSPALARTLVEAQFPALAPARLRPLAVGWDNTAYLVNDDLVFRFPRRSIAVPLLDTEARLLPALGRRLPVPIPLPAFRGAPSDAFPWPFIGYRLVPGVTACAPRLDDGARFALAPALGRVLAALHAFPVEEAMRLGAGPDRIGRLEVRRLRPIAAAAVADLGTRGLLPYPAPLLAVLDAVPDDVPVRSSTVVHGDLYARHLLVDPEHRLAGLIDWGDLHVGDPAVDLQVVHTLLPAAARGAFRDAYGPVEARAWRLARFRAVRHTAAVLAYADDAGDRDLRDEALAAARHLAETDAWWAEE